MPNFWLDRQLDKLSDKAVAQGVESLIKKFDLYDKMIDWHRDLHLQDIYLHIETTPMDGVVSVDTLYSSFPKPATGKLLKFERGSKAKDVLLHLLLEHYSALGFD